MIICNFHIPLCIDYLSNNDFTPYNPQFDNREGLDEITQLNRRRLYDTCLFCSVERKNTLKCCNELQWIIIKR